MSKLAYTAEKSAWATVIVALGFVGSLLGQWWQSRDVTPPAPVPVVIDEARSYVTRNGVTVSDADAKAIISAVKIGDGSYSLVSYPIGERPVTKSLLIGDVQPPKPDVVPIPPKPVDPPKPVQPDTKPTAAIYFYEKDQTAIPPYVSAGLNQINRKGIDATLFEVDTKSSTGQIPERFRVPHAEAVKAGVPVLVIVSGQTVTKVIKSPKSLEEITGAVQ